jgi:hypothetical protein
MVVALVPVRVVEHVQRNVDVGVLFFLALKEAVPRHRALRMGAANTLLLELPLNDLDFREGAQRSEKRELALLLCQPVNQGGKVLDRLKIVIWAQFLE